MVIRFKVCTDDDDDVPICFCVLFQYKVAYFLRSALALQSPFYRLADYRITTIAGKDVLAKSVDDYKTAFANNTLPPLNTDAQTYVLVWHTFIHSYMPPGSCG